MMENQEYDTCWLDYKQDSSRNYPVFFSNLVIQEEESPIILAAKEELVNGITAITGMEPRFSTVEVLEPSIILTTLNNRGISNEVDWDQCEGALNDEGYALTAATVNNQNCLLLIGKTDKGLLYATFHLLRLLQTKSDLENVSIVENPVNQLRMLNHWDNMDGSIERGYAGNSIFYKDYQFTKNFKRIKDYARLMASIGINGIAINNVNVHEIESKLITSEYLPDVAEIAGIFRSYGIKTFLSINYASTIQLGGLDTADPLDSRVREWWKEKTAEVYNYIPDFGGYVVKADSEHRPGPFTYNRNHADGSNMLAEALLPFNGVVIWRCFVYNCLQDWRDRETDRARAAYDHFKPLDGQFMDNVILQIKNGPMDFQVREPVSPLFGAMPTTNQIIEFQITQEYTGQQKHLCYLIPQWKEVLDFDTYAKGEGSPVKRIVDGSLYSYKFSGVSAVINVGDDSNWTGHTLAQANLYGYGRLTWNPELSAEDITNEWIIRTFGADEEVLEQVNRMLADSWRIYENYTAPLGVGWMVNPNHHYGPNVDGYEYSVWGTYHYADFQGIGVNRTVTSGTGYTTQYFPENTSLYESLETCPDNLVLFFHHVPYTHQLKSGETVIQHIYNTHFVGVEQVTVLKERWEKLNGRVDKQKYKEVLERLEIQLAHSKEWRDIINTYFYRKSGIADELGRKIY
ncbi:alpha-glucuronidase family glycosyl hydrolase [Sutcliffiella halmapala]|uniref:alpha-glucuronidase family glycosyl hydrolase n=1 Tax=Sutcliffiella halmapala TaxID=79882 RepID=UPI001F1D68E0|nr:alpha-glucuronidase family glycosyl hydrolase [Sutcliffiella halmapala]